MRTRESRALRVIAAGRAELAARLDVAP